MNIFTMNPNLIFFILAGGRGRGARVSGFFHKKSKSKRIFFFGGRGEGVGWG